MKASEFFRWWRAQLLELLPPALRSSWQDGKSQLVLHIRGDGVELHAPALRESVRFTLPPGDTATPPPEAEALLARLRGGPQRISLVLSPDDYLLRELTLPRAAQGSLAEAVGYQLPQLTPFSVSQLIYACGETADSPAEGPLSVWLVAVPRQRVARALGLVGQAPPDGYLPLRQPPAAGEEVELSWRVAETSTVAQHRWRIAWLGLAALWLGVLGLHLYHQHQAQTRLDQTLEELRSQAQQVGALSDRLDIVRAQAQRLSGLKQSAYSPLVLLDALTEQLDDQTWLEGFDLRDGRLTLRGVSTSAATLIETLEATPLLRDVRFDAAITRARRSEGDRFNISAQLEAPSPGNGS
jgi:general secretion pathway protein L